MKTKGAGSKPEPVTRLKAMKARGEMPLWPPNPVPHLTEWFIEIGPTIAGAMGEGPIGWQDILAWQRLTGIPIDPWEARTIRRLSDVFVSQRQAAEKPSCPAPYTGMDDDVAATRASVANRVKALFSGLQKKGP